MKKIGLFIISHDKIMMLRDMINSIEKNLNNDLFDLYICNHNSLYKPYLDYLETLKKQKYNIISKYDLYVLKNKKNFDNAK